MRTKIYSIISVPAVINIYIFTIFIVIVVLVFGVFRMKKMISGIISFWAKSCFFLMGKKLHIEGTDNISKDKNYILVANHSSYFDILAIMAFYPNVSWFGRERLMKIPVFGTVLKTINYVPMKASDLRNTTLMINKLIENSKNNTIAIFPEGTRTLDGNFNRFKKGFIISTGNIFRQKT